MAWLAVDGNGDEFFATRKPWRNGTGKEFWTTELRDDFKETKIHFCKIEKGSIEKLIGYKLTWKDEPVEI